MPKKGAVPYDPRGPPRVPEAPPLVSKASPSHRPERRAVPAGDASPLVVDCEGTSGAFVSATGNFSAGPGPMRGAGLETVSVAVATCDGFRRNCLRLRALLFGRRFRGWSFCSLRCHGTSGRRSGCLFHGRARRLRSGERARFAASRSFAAVTGVPDVNSDPAKVPVRIADDAAATSGKGRRQHDNQSAVQHQRQHPARNRGQSPFQMRSTAVLELSWKSRICHEGLDSRRRSSAKNGSAAASLRGNREC